MSKLWCSSAIAAIALAGCVDHKDPVTGTTSIRVELVAPTDPGDMTHRLPNDLHTVTVNLTALLPDGQVDTAYDNDVMVGVQYLGTLTPLHPAEDNKLPITFHIAHGVAMDQTVTLPPTFGPSVLWVDDDQTAHPTYAVGTSPTLWYEEPTIADVQTPDLTRIFSVLTKSPLATKQVTVARSRYGSRGRLVVTTVFSQGYTVQDVECADDAGTPPCTSQAFDSIEVFSFSQPADQSGHLLKTGQTIQGFSGAISDFNGLTEVGFPVTMTTPDDATVNLARIPEPALFSTTWFGPLQIPDPADPEKQIIDPKGMINFENNEAALVEVKGAKVCNLDDDFETFNQWKIDPNGQGGDCSGKKGQVINVVTAGISDIDPRSLVGKTLPSVVGALRSVETIPVWIIYPRSSADITQ